MFDPEQLPNIDRYQMVWYAKMHTKQEGGSRFLAIIKSVSPGHTW